MTSTTDVIIRPLVPEDADGFVALDRRSLLEESPFIYSTSLDEDAGSDPELVRARLASSSDSVVLGAFAAPAGSEFAPELVGTVGVYRELKRKIAHKGRVWGMYLVPSWRGQGVGQQLLAAAIQAARDLPGLSQLQLAVSESAFEATRLYESYGFRTWGREPNALCHQGHCVDMLHLVLDLD